MEGGTLCVIMKYFHETRGEKSCIEHSKRPGRLIDRLGATYTQREPATGDLHTCANRQHWKNRRVGPAYPVRKRGERKRRNGVHCPGRTKDTDASAGRRVIERHTRDA